MRNPPPGRAVVYYPDPRSRYYQAGQDVPFQPPSRPMARRRKPGPPLLIWPGIPIGLAALVVVSGAMDGARPHKATPPPAPAPKVITHTITRTVAAHPMPGWEAIGLGLIVGFVILGVVALIVHAYRSRA
jgi:hypothetical protein